MREIKKIFIFIGLCLLKIYSFSFQISDVRFDKIIEKGTSGTKEYMLTNNTQTTKVYRLDVDKEKNVKVSPNVVELAPLDSKKINIKVIGNGKKGKYSYFFIIKEIDKYHKDVNRIVKIKHEYMIK